jgi:hypothetical protein
VRVALYDDGSAVNLTEFIGVASKSHRSIAKCDIYRSGEPIEYNVPIVSGTVTIDRMAAVRSRCSVVLHSRSLIPTQYGGILTPEGYELRLWRGIRLRSRTTYPVWGDYITHNGEFVTHNGAFVVLGSDGTIYGEDIESRNAWVSLGYFAIQESNVDGQTLEIRVEGEDRSRTVSDAKLTDAVSWVTTDSLEVKVEEMLRQALPSIPFFTQYQGSSHSAANVTHERGADPMQSVLDAAQAVGHEAYWDSFGTFVWRPEPDLRSATPVTEVYEGAGGTLVSLNVSRSRRPSYNAAPVVGDNPTTDAEYYAMAVDNDPMSPSYYYGPFGKKPSPVFRDAQIDSQAKADAASSARLAANLGRARILDLSQVPNPILEPGDAVRVRRRDVYVDDEVALIDKQTIGLGATDRMTLEARTRVMY